MFPLNVERPHRLENDLQNISLRKVVSQVLRLQRRIFRAGKVRSLQNLLIRSRSAKLLAISEVFPDFAVKLKKISAGIDGNKDDVKTYTQFVYENLKINKNKVSEGETFTVSIDIINSGICFGTEIIQLYIQDVECSVERSLKELKGFKKIKLDPSEKKTITFKLENRDLSFFDEKNNCWRAEKGIFKILVGSSSRNIRLEGKVEYLG